MVQFSSVSYFHTNSNQTKLQFQTGISNERPEQTQCLACGNCMWQRSSKVIRTNRSSAFHCKIWLSCVNNTLTHSWPHSLLQFRLAFHFRRLILSDFSDFDKQVCLIFHFLDDDFMNSQITLFQTCSYGSPPQWPLIPDLLSIIVRWN